MGQVSRLRIVIVLVLLSLGAFMARVERSAVAAAKPVPLSVGIGAVDGWRYVGDTALSFKVTDALDLDDYLFRTYSDGTHAATLYIGYYLTAGKVGAAHDPLVCLPGQGWSVSEQSRGEFATGLAGEAVRYSAMVAGLEGNRELFVYWFQAFDRTTPDTLRQKIVLWQQKLLGGGEDNAFVRVSIPLGDRSVEEGLRVAERFIHHFYPVFHAYVTSGQSEAASPAALTAMAEAGNVSGGWGEPLLWKILLVGCLSGVVYVYLGYPLIAFILARVRPRPVRRGNIEPRVTVLIAAYNEAGVIRNTIENKLALDYPREKLEILVVSDGSDDGTDEIVRGYADQGVRLIRQEPRAGKTSALNLAVPQVAGEIIVFSDANSIYAADALRRLVSNFFDPQVGYVTGKMVYTNPDGSPNGDGCTSYMRYENRLRAIETRLGSLVGVDGGIDAVRKELYRPMNSDQLPDFVLPLQVVKQGYRVVYEPGAVLHESALSESSDEYRMRVRVSLRALWALFDMRRLLFCRGNLLFSWQLWSHKVLRYLCFLFLGGAFASNLALVPEGYFYILLLALQVSGYLAAFGSALLENAGYRMKLLALPHYFALLNMASAHAFWKFLRRQKQVLWTPRKG